MVLKKNQPGYSEAKDKNGKTYWKKTEQGGRAASLDGSIVSDAASDFDTSDVQEETQEEQVFHPSSKEVIPEFEKSLQSRFKFRRGFVYDEGYGLERAIKEEDPALRAKAAKFGYALDYLAEDENEDVRIAVINANHNVVDFRDNDPSERVREAAQRKLEQNLQDAFNDTKKVLNRIRTSKNFR